MVFFEEVTRHKLLRGIMPDQDILPVAKLNALAAAYTAFLAGLIPDEWPLRRTRRRRDIPAFSIETRKNGLSLAPPVNPALC